MAGHHGNPGLGLERMAIQDGYTILIDFVGGMLEEPSNEGKQ